MTTLIIASRYLMGRKLRTFLTTLAIVFGVFLVFGMNILVPTMVDSFTSALRSAAGQVDITITDKNGDTFSTSVLSRVASVDGVQAAVGSLRRTLNLPDSYFDHNASVPDRVSTLELVGLDPDRVAALQTYTLTAGRFLRRSDTSSTVITTTLAEAAGVGLGDTLVIPTPRGKTSLTVVGLLPARAVPGSEQVLVSLAEGQYLLNKPDKINTIEANFNTTDAARRDQIAQTIIDMLGDKYQAGTMAGGSEILNSIVLAQVAFSLFGFLALLMGAFIIFNTFRTVVAERRHDIGVLRSLGASRGHIVGLILAEGLLQGVIGTAIGMVLGYGLAAASVALMQPIFVQYLHMEFGQLTIPPLLVLITASIGIGMTVVAGLIPALNASRVTPLEALRPTQAEVATRQQIGPLAVLGEILIFVSIAALLSNDIKFSGLGVFLFLAGLVLVAPALLVPIARLFNLLLTAVIARDGTGEIAQANLSRQPSRGAITASATMIGLAMIVAVGGLVASVRSGFLEVVRNSLGSDYLLMPPAVGIWENNVGSNNTLADRLRRVDGVGVVSTLRPALAKAEGKDSTVLGIDPVNYPKVAQLTFVQGDSTTAYAMLGEGRNAIINGILATQATVGLGQTLRLAAPAGQQDYTIVGIASDYFNAKIPTVYISQANLKRDFGKDEDVFLQLNLLPGADPAQVEPKIAAVAAAYPQYKLVSGQEYYQQNEQILDAAFLAYDVLLGILAVPALIAMVNTLAIAIIERTREIGMLRATGATRGQVRRMVLAEALLLSGVGTAFGVIAGLYLGYVLVEAMHWAGYPVSYFFPTQGIVAAILVGLIFGAIAAIIPARQAARLEIVRALQYE